MQRRNFLQLLSALPLLGWLKPEPYLGGNIRTLVWDANKGLWVDLNTLLEDAMTRAEFIAPMQRVSIYELEAMDEFNPMEVAKLRQQLESEC